MTDSDGPRAPDTIACRSEMERVFSESPDDAARLALLDRSLGPRGPAMLYDVAAGLGLRAEHRVLDAGCRDDGHARELSRRFGCRVIGIDLTYASLATARAALARDGRGDATFLQASIDAIPLAPACIDFVWCRDMLGHVPDLPAALGECARVLKPRGSMLVYVTLATELLEPAEARRVLRALAMCPESMERGRVEAAFAGAGLEVVEREEIAGEWRERMEEDGARTTSTQLLRIARALRARKELAADTGERFLEVELADCHWGVYQMLGKLCPTIYALRKRS